MNLDGNIDLPGVGGGVPKKAVLAVAVGAAAFVGWKYWQGRNGTGDDAGTDTTVSDFADTGGIPGVLGAVSPTNSYGSSDTGSTSDSGSVPGKFTTNADWTNYARTQLGNTYEDSAMVEALGNFLAAKPTSDEQQKIVRAALAVAGYPPVAGYALVGGGNTAITVYPENVHVQSVGQDSAVIAFNAVSGATSYRVYRSGISSNVGASNVSPITISGLQPNTSYSVQVSAFSASGQGGPPSPAITFKTTSYTIGKPSTPVITNITKTNATATVTAVPHADGYHWYLDGVLRAYTEGTSYTFGYMKAGTKHTVTVSADIQKQTAGPRSAGKTFTTKK